MATKQGNDFRNIQAERAVLAGICTYGGDAFVDVDDLIDANAFTGSDIHAVVYKSLQHHFRESLDRKLDIPSILSAADAQGLGHVTNTPEGMRHMRALFNYPIERETVRHEAQKLFKLQLTEQIDEIAAQIRRDLRGVTGEESLAEITGLMENPIFDFVSGLNRVGMEGPTHIATGIDDFLDNLENNPRDNIGISSGYPKYDFYIGGGFRRSTVSIIGARMKVGKAQTLTSQVFTPKGPILMGDICVGDEVCTPWGTTATVDSIHPQGMVDVYRVHFSDGDFAECTLDHLWEVRNNHSKIYQILSLGEILQKGLISLNDNRAKWHVRLPESCHYQSSPCAIPPYLLGGLLGDGSSGLWGLGPHDKFIPDSYKYNSQDVRLSVLQGLFDTNGHMDRRGGIEYATPSKRLAYDVKEVTESLGGICRVKYQTGHSLSYRVRIKHDNRGQFFRVEREKKRGKERTKGPLTRTIRSVEYIGKQKAQCIKLNSHDGLYLTDHHIVTHNTIFCDNIALHVAGNLNIPVLNLDTEMTREEHLARILAYVCGVRFNTEVTIREIETGKYAQHPDKRSAVRESAGWLKTIPYEYDSVIEKSFEEQVAIMRRWVRRRVGTDDKGVTKDALVIYDYLQAPEPGEFSESFKEYQILGYQMLSLLRTAAKCDVPIFTLVQLNRDGIDKESTAVAADSDRVLRKAANFTILKWKSEDERSQDGEEEGTHKLVPVIARHGEAMAKGDYINIRFDHRTAKMTEMRTRNEIQKSKGPKSQKSRAKGFEVEAEAQNGDNSTMQPAEIEF